MQNEIENNLVMIDGFYLLRSGYLVDPCMIRDGGKFNQFLARTTDSDLEEVLELHEALKRL